MAADKKSAGINSLVRSLESTLVNDPEGLAYIPLIIESASEARQVAVAMLMERGIPRRILAEIMKCDETNVTKHANAGRKVIAARQLAADVDGAQFPAAAIDRARRDAIAKAILLRHSAAAGGAEIPDDTAAAG